MRSGRTSWWRTRAPTTPARWRAPRAPRRRTPRAPAGTALRCAAGGRRAARCAAARGRRPPGDAAPGRLLGTAVQRAAAHASPQIEHAWQSGERSPSASSAPRPDRRGMPGGRPTPGQPEHPGPAGDSARVGMNCSGLPELCRPVFRQSPRTSRSFIKEMEDEPADHSRIRARARPGHPGRLLVPHRDHLNDGREIQAVDKPDYDDDSGFYEFEQLDGKRAKVNKRPGPHHQGTLSPTRRPSRSPGQARRKPPCGGLRFSARHGSALDTAAALPAKNFS